MGSWLKKIILFTTLLFVLLLLMNRWMDRELNPHYPLQYQEVFHPQVKANMIILGASHATHGINPKYIERDQLKVYNFSLNGAGPLFNLNWYRKIFQHYYPKPLYAIYGVHWGMFDDSLLKRKFEQDSHYFPLPFLVKELRELNSFKELLLNRFAFIRERKHLASRLFHKKFRDVYLPSKYYHGFIPFERKGGLDGEDTVNPRNNPAQIKAFEELLDEFEKDGIQVIFVHVPGYSPGRGASNLAEGMHLLNRISKARDIPFLDYETERISSVNTDKSLYSDWAHLNEKGSDTFSALLKKDLEKLIH